MSQDARQIREDRRLRDAARALVRDDWANLRGNMKTKSIGQRAAGRISAGASDVYDEAIEVAADHKGALAAIVAALVLWFARNPIRDLVTGHDSR